MATIPVPNVAQVELIYNSAGNIVENVLHYQIPGTATAADLQLFAAAVHAEWIVNMKPQIPNEMSLSSIKITDLTTNVSPTITYTTGLPEAGTQGVAIMPLSVTCAFTKRTALRGRNNRGRLYWPAFVEGAVLASAIMPSTVIAIVNGINAMRTIPSSLGSWEMVVVSRYLNKNPRPSGIFTPVTAITSDGIVDSQRRRLPGRGQ